MDNKYKQLIDIALDIKDFGWVKKLYADSSKHDELPHVENLIPNDCSGDLRLFCEGYTCIDNQTGKIYSMDAYKKYSKLQGEYYETDEIVKIWIGDNAGTMINKMCHVRHYGENFIEYDK